MYYDEGWDAFAEGVAYDPRKTIDWRDGWKDAQEFHKEWGFCKTFAQMLQKSAERAEAVY